jgi:membrane fusion protein, type I secretion system
MSRSMTHLPFGVPVDESGESTRIVRIGLFVIVVFLGGFFAWAALAPISGAVIAGGTVKIDTNRKTVQHLDGGIVKEILVREGSVVEKGQPLILLEDTESSAAVNILSDQLDAMLAKEARLHAEKHLLDSIVFPEALLNRSSAKITALLRNEKALFRSKRKSLDDQIDLLDAEIEQAKKQVSGLTDQIDAVKEHTGYVEEQLAAAESLKEKKFIGINELLQLKRLLAEQKENMGEQISELASARKSIHELKLRIITARNAYAQQADDELKETRRMVYEIEERLRPAQGALARQIVTAPIAGQVINLQVTTVGGVVQPGEPLMDIVPAANEMIIEAKARTEDIDNLYIGQDANITLSAYSRRSTPQIEGKVIYVSGDALVDEHTGEAYYLVHVRADKEALNAIDGVTLFPGMPAVVFLKTGDRTFLDYLLAPIMDNLRKTFREA